MNGMARRNPPKSMQHHLRQRLNEYARDRWPQLQQVQIRYRAGFAYLDAVLPDGNVQPLCRLRFTGVLHTWGFAIYLASRRQLPGRPAALWAAIRQPGRSPRLRLRPLPQRPHRLAHTPDELMRRSTVLANCLTVVRDRVGPRRVVSRTG